MCDLELFSPCARTEYEFFKFIDLKKINNSMKKVRLGAKALTCDVCKISMNFLVEFTDFKVLEPQKFLLHPWEA